MEYTWIIHGYFWIIYGFPIHMAMDNLWMIQKEKEVELICLFFRQLLACFEDRWGAPGQLGGAQGQSKTILNRTSKHLLTFVNI